MPVPTTYEIVIRGRLGRRLLRPLLDDFTIEPGDGQTRLVGIVQDPPTCTGSSPTSSVAAEVVRIAARPPPDSGNPRPVYLPTVTRR
ncbi:MAG: hypothetical protein R2755_28865 [Acidimicrobiales bacterium]